MGELETLPDHASLQAHSELLADPFGGPPLFPDGSRTQRALAELMQAADATAQVSLLRTIPGNGADSALAILAAHCRSLGRTVVVLTPDDHCTGLARRVLQALGLGDIAGDEIDIHNILRVFLLNEFARGRLPTLILTDAHRYSARQLSELLGLLKLRHQGELAVKLVLTGAPALEKLLTASELAPLAARCSAVQDWPCLPIEEFRRWVNLCVSVAGAPETLFSAAAIEQVHQVTGGATGTAACLLRRALAVAQAHGEQAVTRECLPRLVSPICRQAANDPIQQSAAPRLTIRRGTRLVSELSVDMPRLVLGRDASADVVLSDAWVSRYHALLIRDAQGLWLADLASTNGTRVNGRQVHTHRLQHGEVIRLGQFAIELDCPDTADSLASEREATRQLRRFRPFASR